MHPIEGWHILKSAQNYLLNMYGRQDYRLLTVMGEIANEHGWSGFITDFEWASANYERWQYIKRLQEAAK